MLKGASFSHAFQTQASSLTDQTHRASALSSYYIIFSPNTSYLDNLDCFLMTVHALLLSHIQFILRTTIHPLKFLLLPYCFLAPNTPSFSTVYRIKFKILSLSQRLFYTDCESCLLIQEEILSVSYPAAGTL